MIITPRFPCTNCAYNVSTSTLRVIREQLIYANNLMTGIKNGKCSWESLFAKLNFFREYRHFIEIDVLAKYKKDFHSWKGHVESRLRKLTKLLEGPNYC